MSRTLQFKRYTKSVLANTIGADGELIIDTNNYTITVHNANTAGGIRLVTESTFANTNNLANSAYNLAAQEPVGSQAYVTSQSASSSANNAYNQANSAYVLAQSAFNTANNASNGFIQNAQTAAYTLQSTDAGKYLYYTPAANVILYLPWTSNISFTNGTTIMVVSQNTGAAANIVITPNVNVSLFTAGNTISGSHNVNPYGVATLMMVKANTWFITGFGVN